MNTCETLGKDGRTPNTCVNGGKITPNIKKNKKLLSRNFTKKTQSTQKTTIKCTEKSTQTKLKIGLKNTTKPILTATKNIQRNCKHGDVLDISAKNQTVYYVVQLRILNITTWITKMMWLLLFAASATNFYTIGVKQSES